MLLSVVDDVSSLAEMLSVVYPVIPVALMVAEPVYVADTVSAPTMEPAHVPELTE
jgi:hypothetical protein